MEAIRFTILKIKLQMPEDCRLPRHKVSAIRGGMGNVTVREGLKPGDKVLMMRVQRGNKYIVLSKIT